MFRLEIEYKNYIFLLFPLTLLLGSAVVNLFLILGTVYFLHYISKNKVKLLNYNWEYFIYLFISYVIILSFFSNEPYQSLKSSISQIRFLFFSLFLSLINFDKIFTSFKNILILILIFVCIDTNIQFIFGYDIFGTPAEGYKVEKYPIFSHWINKDIVLGRLSGPFGTELIPGAFIASLSSPLIFYFLKNIQLKDYKKIFFILLLFESTLITGERLAFLMIFFCIFFASLLRFTLQKVLTCILLLLISLTLVLNFSKNNFLKKRWVDAYSIAKNISSSSYGRIYLSAIYIWKENKLFGTGLKNYRFECTKLKDPNPKSLHNFCSPTHPHNLYLELLVETGVIGIFLYILFYLSLVSSLFRNLRIKNKKKYHFFIMGSFFYLIFKLLPLPSGSVFSTWNASFFWFHLGICLNYVYSKKFKK